MLKSSACCCGAYIKQPPWVIIFNVFKVTNIPVCLGIPVVPCAVPELPVLGRGDCNCASPLLYLPLPSCLHCMALPSHTSTFCEELISRVHFLTQIMFGGAHMLSTYGSLKPEYQLCSLQSYSQDQLQKNFNYMS